MQNNTYSPYFGAVIGRVANRIADATFELGGVRYRIPANDHGHALHGGRNGWSVKTWNLTQIESNEGDAVRLTYISPDGDEVRYEGLAQHGYANMLDEQGKQLFITMRKGKSIIPCPSGVLQLFYVAQSPRLTASYSPGGTFYTLSH